VNSKILAMSWTNDGLHLALGLFSGPWEREMVGFLVWFGRFLGAKNGVLNWRRMEK